MGMLTQRVQIWAFNHTTIVTTPFQLLQWKHALGLEEKGLILSRGRKVSTHLRKLLKTPAGYPVADLRRHITSSLDDINEQLGVAP